MALKNVKEAASYLRKIANLLGLQHWDLRVVDDPPANNGALATVRVAEKRRCATILLSREFFAQNAKEQRYIAVHECIHINNAESDAVAESFMTEEQQKVWCYPMEYAVDALAKAVAPRFPLPGEG